MIKIWGKVILKEKIAKSKTVLVDETNTTFFDMLTNMCQQLNIATPVLLDKHVYDFNLFHVSIFKPEDFIDEVYFDSFVLQLVSVE